MGAGGGERVVIEIPRCMRSVDKEREGRCSYKQRDGGRAATSRQKMGRRWVVDTGGVGRGGGERGEGG